MGKVYSLFLIIYKSRQHETNSLVTSFKQAKLITFVIDS